MWKAINYQANCFPSWPRHPLLNFFITQQTLWFIHGRLVGGNSIHKTSSLDSGQCILCHKSLAHPIRDNENKIEAVQRDSSLDMAMTRPVREGRSKKSRKSKGTNSTLCQKMNSSPWKKTGWLLHRCRQCEHPRGARRDPLVATT